MNLSLGRAAACSFLVATFALVAACEDPKVPESSCKVVPPQTANASATEEQAAKLNAKVVNMPMEGGAEFENRAEAQIQETYQAVPDKQAACAMLFQTIECLERRNANSAMASKLAENVVTLCAGGPAPGGTSPPPGPSDPPPPASGTPAPSSTSPTGAAPPPATTTTTAPPPPPATITPVSTPEPGITQCSVRDCGIATKTSCEVSCRAPKQARCGCEVCGSALGVVTCLRENCRCE